MMCSASANWLTRGSNRIPNCRYSSFCHPAPSPRMNFRREISSIISVILAITPGLRYAVQATIGPR